MCIDMKLQSRWQPRTLEDVLGPSQGRFFGDGYRGVRHVLETAPETTEHAGAEWLARVSYPPNWSKDEAGISRRPHLSTVDAVVLPLKALDALDVEESDPSRLTTAHVSRIDLRAGSEPWFELDSVPLSIRRSETDESPADSAGTSAVRAFDFVAAPHE